MIWAKEPHKWQINVACFSETEGTCSQTFLLVKESCPHLPQSESREKAQIKLSESDSKKEKWDWNEVDAGERAGKRHKEREELEVTAFRRQQEHLEDVVSWQGRT